MNDRVGVCVKSNRKKALNRRRREIIVWIMSDVEVC